MCTFYYTISIYVRWRWTRPRPTWRPWRPCPCWPPPGSELYIQRHAKSFIQNAGRLSWAPFPRRVLDIILPSRRSNIGAVKPSAAGPPGSELCANHRLPNGVRTNVYIYIYICIYIHTCIYIYIYTLFSEVPQYTMIMTWLWHNYGIIMGNYGTSI